MSLESAVLLSPDPVARAAALVVTEPSERWMLCQSWSVRVSFAREAMNGDERDQMIWMLRQSDDVRRSYMREVLEGGGVPAEEKDQACWMLRQATAVRESFVREVLHADPLPADTA
jgi:hypothetical protein